MDAALLWTIIGSVSGVAGVAITAGTVMAQSRSRRPSDDSQHALPEAGRNPPPPRQLPAAGSYLVGRSAEMRALDNLITQLDRDPRTVLISAVNGAAGIGKTSLALYWAQRAAKHFPDGQLYVNLRGFDSLARPLPPANVLLGFLHALEVPLERIPDDLEQRAALFRSLVAGRRMFIVLDNAHDTDQVLPLIPGTADCLVLITSRNRLTGLVSSRGARLITLDVLSDQASRDLLARHIGDSRLEDEPDTVTELITRCARLPLALSIIAARAASTPDLPLRALASELQTQQGRLDALDTGDHTLNVRAVLSCSLNDLSPQAARLFRLLGAAPLPDVSRSAAASLMGLPAQSVRAQLLELTGIHLLEERDAGRYRFHDLVKDYANESTADEDLEHLNTATQRLLDHYLRTGLAADRCLNPPRVPVTPPTVLPGITVGSFTGYAQAWAWFGAENANLVILVDHAARRGFNTHAWQLAWTLTTFLDREGRWHDQVAVQETALAAAGRLGDRAAQAGIHRLIGQAHAWLNHPTEALRHCEEALALFEDLGDVNSQARTLYTLAWALGERDGRHGEALRYARRALQLYDDIGDPSWQARTLTMVGSRLIALGDHDEALTHCTSARHLFRSLTKPDIHGEAITLDSLGLIHHHLGAHDHAITCFRQALDLWREQGHHYYEARTLRNLGDTQHASGDPAAARRSWRQALTILIALGHPDAEPLRTRI